MVSFEQGTGHAPSTGGAGLPVPEQVSATAAPPIPPTGPAPVPTGPAPAPMPSAHPLSVKPARSNGRAGAGTILLAVGLIVAVGGVAFAVGRVTAPAAAAAGTTRVGGGAYGGILGPNGQPTGSFVPGADGFRAFGGALGGLTGTVAAITADTLTIQVGGASGRTIEVPLSSSTAFHAETPATAGDVTVGAEVTVRVQRDTAAATQGGSAQGGQAGGLPQASGSPRAGAAAPGAGGPPGLVVGTATDVTVVAPTRQ
jgi:preprotein translocase subunit YajC